MTDRIRTILDAGDAAGLPEIARVLALDTALEPEAAALVFAGAAKDIATATASAAQTLTPPPVASLPAGQQVSHGLGQAEPVGGVGKEAVQASWSKAVAHANRGFESLGA